MTLYGFIFIAAVLFALSAFIGIYTAVKQKLNIREGLLLFIAVYIVLFICCSVGYAMVYLEYTKIFQPLMGF